jgi:asparagine synthetase B (glutamine-hydrolysing)
VLPPTDAELPRLKSLEDVPEYLSSAVENLIFHLDCSVALRASNIPRRSVESPSIDKDRVGPPVSARVGVLFSGGIDSTVCAFLAAK